MPQCLLKAVCHLFKIGILAVFLSKINKQKIIIFSLFHTVFQNSNSPFSFHFIVCLLFCFMTFILLYLYCKYGSVECSTIYLSYVCGMFQYMITIEHLLFQHFLHIIMLSLKEKIFFHLKQHNNMNVIIMMIC